MAERRQPEDPSHPPQRRPRFLLFATTTLAAVALDLVSKTYAFHVHATMQGPYGRDQPFLWFSSPIAEVSLVRQANHGIAFGLLQESNLPLLITVRGTIVLSLLALGLRRHGTAIVAVLLGLFAGGALGNLADNLWTYDPTAPHAVRDFLHIAVRGFAFPVFNLADVLVGIGAGGLILLPFLRRRS